MRFREIRKLVVLASLPCLLIGTSAAATAGTEGRSTSTVGMEPQIDPDQQVREAQASQDDFGRLRGVPAPGSKIDSPATNLTEFPKRNLADLEREAAEEAKRADGDPAKLDHIADVQSTDRSVDGKSTTVTLYTPAPKVSAEQLAKFLRDQGKKEVTIVSHGTEGQRGVPSNCSYQYAMTITCPVSYWSNNGFADPLVRFNDHSGSLWPTDNAVYKWNQTRNIDSAYRFNACPFQAGARCVDVYSGNYGNTTTGGVPWVGLATRKYDGSATSGLFAEQGHYVQLNQAYAPTTFTRNNVVTHELGHILGLGHNGYSADVLYPYANNTEVIGGQNPLLLADLYSIVR